MEPWLRHRIAELTAQYGTVPPPWVVFDEHPVSICWRMGGGESHMMLWREWWPEQPLSIEERIAYFRRWPPPHCWLPFLIQAVWGADVYEHEVEGGNTSPFYAYTELLGFGSHDDHIQDFNDPEWLE
jgi:hypothetical protein